MAKKMKLSTAIKMGMKKTDYCSGAYFIGKTQACAIGAAYFAVTGRRDDDLRGLYEKFPILTKEVRTGKHKGLLVEDAVYDISDGSNWNKAGSRLRAAQFVERLEKHPELLVG